MKYVSALSFLLLILLTLLAWLFLPSPPHEGTKELVWSTSGTPTRPIIVDGIENLYPDIRIATDYNNSSLDKVIIQSNSGVGPDIFDINNRAQLQIVAEMGIAMDTTNFADAHGIGKNAVWSKIEGINSYLGRQFGYFGSVVPPILLYNKNVFDSLGVEYPTDGMTWEQLIDLALKVDVKSESAGNRIFGIGDLGWKDFFASLEGEYFSEDLTQVDVTSEEMIKAFQMHKDFLFRHKIMPSALELANFSGPVGSFNTTTPNLFAQGKIAMIRTGMWSVQIFTEVIRAQKATWDRENGSQDRPGAQEGELLRIGAVLVPGFEGRSPSYELSTRMVMINRNTKYPEYALKALSFNATSDYSEIFKESALPPNPNTFDGQTPKRFEEDFSSLSFSELQRVSLDSMNHIHILRLSPFLWQVDVERVLSEALSRLEVDPDADVADLLSAAQEELDALMKRNLEKEPRLRALYEKAIK